MLLAIVDVNDKYTLLQESVILNNPNLSNLNFDNS